MSEPLYRAGQWLSVRTPDTVTWKAVDCLSDLQWRRCSGYRDTVSRNLSAILGEPVSPTSRQVREVFRSFGRYLVEFFGAHAVRRLELRVEGQHHIAEARAGGRGVIIVSAHLGNWELLGAVVAQQMGLPISAVALPHGDAGLNAVFDRQRARYGVQVIPFGRSATDACLRTLREGRCLGLIGDQEFGDDAMPVTLFGQTARIPRGPSLLSLRAQAPMVPMFMLREGRWRFRVCIEAPIWPGSRIGPGSREGSRQEGAVGMDPQTHKGGGIDRKSALRAITERYVSVLERHIRQVPTQWLLFRPLGVPDGSAASHDIRRQAAPMAP